MEELGGLNEPMNAPTCVDTDRLTLRVNEMEGAENLIPPTKCT